MKWMLSVVLVGVASVASGQTVVNPTKAQFTVSPDHAVVVNGTAVVDLYRLTTHVWTGVLGPLSFTKDVPKGSVSPNGSGVATVTITELTSLASGTYSASIVAVGPGGVSTPSTAAPFAAIGKPGAPSGLVLVP